MTLWTVAFVGDTQRGYGPFDDRAEAIAFAEFLTAEVDPATVMTLTSPSAELLSFYRAGLMRSGGTADAFETADEIAKHVRRLDA